MKQKNKLILIYPKTGMDVQHVTVIFPSSILYVAKSLLNEHFEVVFIDQRITSQWKEMLEKELLLGGILCVGISAMAGSQIGYALEISKIIKEFDKKIPIIWGGPHPSLSPEMTIAHPLIDCLVVDDGELTFVNLARAIQKNKSWDAVDNLVFKKDEKIITTKRSVKVDVNKIPMPAYELVNVKDYICSQTIGNSDFAMVTSRGCTHRCAFCYLEGLHKHTYRPLDPELVVAHIKFLVKSYGINALSINEDNFFNYKERAKKVCELLIKENLNVKIRTSCRIDYVCHYSIDFLKLIKQAGFVELFLGVESGSDRILEKIKKDITVEQIKMANEKLKEVGIVPKYSFMIGLPGETKEEMIQTLKLMVELVEKYPKAHTTPAYIFTPQPGTPLFYEAVQQGYKPPQSLEEYATVHWNKVLMPWIDEEMSKFMVKASYLTYFCDGQSVIEYVRPSYFLKKCMNLYSFIVKFRIKSGFYFCTPEVFFMKKYFGYK